MVCIRIALTKDMNSMTRELNLDIWYEHLIFHLSKQLFPFMVVSAVASYITFV